MTIVPPAANTDPSPDRSASPIRYRIVPLDLGAHLFEVRCTIDDPDPDGQRLRLPTWIPGSYLIREFARHWVSVRAESDGQAVLITKEAKDVWRAAPCAGPLTIVGQVYAFDLSVRTAYLDASRGYFNGTSVFLRPEGRHDSSCEVEIVRPAGAAGADWKLATTLPVRAIDADGFGAYRAADYDELVDHPVEMGNFAAVSFTAGGARHDVVVSGRQRADLSRLATDLARICQWQCDLFGGAADSRAPFERYLFQVAAVGDGYGGLEHRTSTSLLCRREELPQPGAAGISADYRRFLGLASHEYFHAWNVKRIKPAAFTPYDLARECYTRQLWAFEGITSYYDDLALVRCGLIDTRSYLELLGRTITSVLRNPGRQRQSVAESSFDAWIKYYRRDENTPNAVVSYYLKGSLVALALDLTLRGRGSSLDALMRVLWTRFGTTGRGVPEDGIAVIATELAGVSLADFFARYVDGTEDPPLGDLLADLGIRLELRVSQGPKDAGGKPAASGSDEPAPVVSFGFDATDTGELRVQHVHASGPAEQAGLAAGDVVVAVDGLRATPALFEAIRRERRPDDRIAVHAFRRDELFTTSLTLQAAPLDTCWLTIDETRDRAVGDNANATRERRDAWLGTTAAK